MSGGHPSPGKLGLEADTSLEPGPGVGMLPGPWEDITRPPSRARGFPGPDACSLSRLLHPDSKASAPHTGAEHVQVLNQLWVIQQRMKWTRCPVTEEISKKRPGLIWGSSRKLSQQAGRGGEEAGGGGGCLCEPVSSPEKRGGRTHFPPFGSNIM